MPTGSPRDAAAGSMAGHNPRDDGRTLQTERLVLRPWCENDIEAMIFLNDDPEVAANTCSISLPYTRESALKSLEKFARFREEGTGIVRAWCLKGSDVPVGGVGLILDVGNNHAELGYSTARTHRCAGYTTEACRALMAWGFADPACGGLGLHRVYARHFTRNPASERVMEKLGMTFEGVQREHGYKDGAYLDLCCHAILRREWDASGEEGRGS